jgi:uncharacterized protein
MTDQHLIGVISDTHIPHRLKVMPARVYELLQGCEVILHAGDLEDPLILEPLRKIAPVYAVRGNVHWQSSTGTHDQDLPVSVTLPVGGHTVFMTHGHINFALTMLDKIIHVSKRPTLDEINQTIIDRLAKHKPREADIVIFGHTHKPCGLWQDGAFYFNPGAVCNTYHPRVEPSIGRLHMQADGNIEPEWVMLD